MASRIMSITALSRVAEPVLWSSTHRDVHPDPVYEPRPHIHPEPRFEPRPVIHPAPRVEPSPPILACPRACEPIEVNPAPVPHPSPIQPPWRVLPWQVPVPPRPVHKAVRRPPQIVRRGQVLDVFI